MTVQNRETQQTVDLFFRWIFLHQVLFGGTFFALRHRRLLEHYYIRDGEKEARATAHLLLQVQVQVTISSRADNCLLLYFLHPPLPLSAITFGAYSAVFCLNLILEEGEGPASETNSLQAKPA